jgi:hypothetical protein
LHVFLPNSAYLDPKDKILNLPCPVLGPGIYFSSPRLFRDTWPSCFSRRHPKITP